MSFPGSFSSQLSSIMEALLKAVVAEVTALVEDGAVELRLELRDRDQQILEKERDIEERDRVIEELRVAVEELTAAREELTGGREEAAQSPAVEERPEQSQDRPDQDWSKDEEETKPFVKSEPVEDLTADSPEPHVSLWPPQPLPSTTAAADATATCSFDSQHETPSCSQYSQESQEFPYINQADLPVDAFLNRTQEQFYPTAAGFPLLSDLCQVQDPARLKNMRKNMKVMSKRRRDYGTYRCDQCGKTFTAKCRLVTHQSVHTGAKLYSCRKCGKRFTRRDNCVRHEKSDPRCKNTPGK